MTEVAPARTNSVPLDDTIIEVEGLEKRFGDLHVLQGVDVHVPRGEITAIVGPNGSGKTTLIKLILGLVRSDDGRIVVDGIKLNGTWQYRERIGYMPQGARFPENLTAREVLAMLKDLRGNPSNTDEELIGGFNLEPELDKPIRTLSGGNRQKVNAVTAFLFNPEIVILDEPTAGLDPVGSSVLKDKIRKEQEHGTTFILTSHIMSELEELADHLVFLLDGHIQFEGPIATLKRDTDQRNLERAIAHVMRERSA